MIRKNLAKVLVIATLLVLPKVSLAVAQAPNPVSGDAELKTYIDPKFGFTVEYPASWFVIPRSDQAGRIGEVLTFSSIDPSQGMKTAGDLDMQSGTQVVVGMRLTEQLPGESLTEWSVNSHNALAVGESSKINQAQLAATRLGFNTSIEAVEFKGILNGSSIRFVDMSIGKAIWFFWTNAKNDGDARVFDHMVSSFKISDSTPRSVEQAYGKPISFAPATKEQVKSQGAIKPAKSASWGTNWTMPWSTYAWQTITTGPGCSSTHQYQSSEAIDYAMPTNTLIHATEEGNVIIAGMDNSGFGNLVKLDHANGYYSLYAHLNSFAVWPGNHLYEWAGLGYSGSTGNSSGPHLHFEVRYGSQSIWIRTLPTTSWISGNPSSPCQTPGNPDGYAYH